MSTISIQRGQTVRWRLVLKQNDTPIDITGGTWEVLDPLSNPLVTFEITDAVNGVSYLNIDKDETRDLRVVKKNLRIRFVDAAGSALAPQTIVLDIR